jgi:hypothetical protein
MLIIRQEQVDALRAVREREFERQAAAYLWRKFPVRCTRLGEDVVRRSVKIAMRKRTEYQFDSEEAVLLYLDLMYMLGFDFDTAAESAWVRATLTDYDLSARTRLILLSQQARSPRHV